MAAVVGAVLVLCCGIGAIGAALSNNKNNGSHPAGAVGPNTPQPAATTAAASQAPAAATTAPATTQPPAAPAGPKTLYGPFKGTGIKKSATFTTPAEWTLQYTYDCSNFGSKGNFQVWEYDASGNLTDVMVNELDKKGTDEVPQHADAGSHYLEMNSECKWTITVVG